MRALTLLLYLLLNCSDVSAAIFQLAPGDGTIQSAVNEAAESDTIMLSPGIFSGDGNRDVSLFSKNLVIISQDITDKAVIDCQGSIEEPHRAFIFDGGQDSSSVIAGLIIRSGFGLSDNALNLSVGGAILCSNNSSPTIRDCKFVGNQSGFGGTAIFLLGNSSPRIEYCLFEDNKGIRGAITANASSPAIIDCEFRNNVGERGSCIYLTSESSPVIDRCTFIGNSSLRGGAIMYGNSLPTITDCLFWKNSSSAAGGTIWSGGTSVSSITNCTIVGSESPIGAAIYADGSSIVIVENSCITQSVGGDVVECFADGKVNLSCSNLFENSNGDWPGCVANQASLNGNISADPLFCDASGGSLWPLAESPLAATNNSCGLLIGAFEVGPSDCPCCIEFTGNIDCDPSGSIDVADLTALIDHLFIGLGPLCCQSSANIDGDENGSIELGGSIDIADLTFLIDHLFINFTPTATCQ